MRFKQGNPIILGFSGEAGTGKTITANTIIPGKSSIITDSFWWDHKFLAMPLYEMANVRRDIEGYKSEERIKYQLHSILFDLFGKSPLYGLPDYDVLVDLVYEIYSMPIEMNREKKPRSFLQNVGSLCREIDPDCFTSWMIRSITRDAAWAEEQDKQYVCIVSDIRMPNEAKGIIEQANGVVIKFTASPTVREQRLFNRDGFLMTPEQADHESERVNDIPAEFITHTLNTDELTVQQQASRSIEIASKELGIVLQTESSPGEVVVYAEN